MSTFNKITQPLREISSLASDYRDPPKEQEISIGFGEPIRDFEASENHYLPDTPMLKNLRVSGSKPQNDRNLLKLKLLFG